MRFGESIAADFFAASVRFEEFLFLLGRAVAMDGIAVERILYGKDYASRGAAAGDFFDDDRVGDVIEAGAAFGVGDSDAGEAEFGGFLESGTREVTGFIEFFRERADFGFGEFADGFLEESLFFREIEIHGWD